MVLVGENQISGEISLDDESHSYESFPNIRNLIDHSINMRICVNCGQVQGQWPLPESILSDSED